MTTACRRGRHEGPSAASHPHGRGAAKMKPWDCDGSSVSTTPDRAVRGGAHLSPPAPPCSSRGSLLALRHRAGRIRAKDQSAHRSRRPRHPVRHLQPRRSAAGHPRRYRRPACRGRRGDRRRDRGASRPQRSGKKGGCVSSGADERIRHGRLWRTRPGRPHSPEDVSPIAG